MTCDVKHTKYQPPVDDWKCPRCDKPPPEGLCIDESAEGAEEDCELLHEGDYMRCYACGYDTNGKAFAARLQKAASLIPCPHCKGKGLVKS